MGTGISLTELLRSPGSLAQAGKFGLVGVSNTLVDAFFYFALSSGAFALILPRAAAKAAGYLAGVINSYYWNRRWTFRSPRPVRQTFLPFVLTNLVGMGINIVLLQFAFEVVGLQEPVAVLAATLGAVLWNYFINKLYVFRKTKDCAPLETQHV